MNDPTHDKRRSIEVEEQADPASGPFEVRSELGKVGGVQHLDCLQFDNKGILNQEVQSPDAYLHSLEFHCQRPLRLEAKVAMG
ncbi:MAG TPA: hypothetical protein VFL88_01950 [Gemmatimonadales bacterium]|nr:hypothetical protein [Gemmatimonadales bacterium]